MENNYTFRLDGQIYQIERAGIVSGLRGASVRVERRLDGTVAVRYEEKYLPVKLCIPAKKTKEKTDVSKPAEPEATSSAAGGQATGKRRQSRRGSDWNRDFDLKKAPKIWQVMEESGGRRGQAD